MLTLPTTVPIYVAAEPVDVRRGFNRLAQAAREPLGRDPLRGGLFLFLNRARDRVKSLFWDSTRCGAFAAARRRDRAAPHAHASPATPRCAARPLFPRDNHRRGVRAPPLAPP